MAGNRIFTRLTLSIAFVAAVAIPVFAFYVRGPDQPETWTIAAAALAVITSVIATWSSRRVVELQEDAKKPNPYPTFDFESRYGLTLLRITNTGGTAAHNVSLEWTANSLKNFKGEIIGFLGNDDASAVSVLLPGESISQYIDSHHDFLGKHPDTEYTGFVSFQDVSGKRYRRPFRLDGRSYRGTPSYADEAPKTHFELQKIPKELELIRRELQRLNKS